MRTLKLLIGDSMPDPKKKVIVKLNKIVPVQKGTKEERAEKKYQCKLSILKILVNSVILETIGAVREGYITNDPIRLEMDGILIDNIESVLEKIEDSIRLCEPYMRFIDTSRLEKLIIDLEYLDVTKSEIYAEEIWNIYAPTLLSI